MVMMNAQAKLDFMRIEATLYIMKYTFFCLFYVKVEPIEQMRVDNNDNEFTHSFLLQTQRLIAWIMEKQNWQKLKSCIILPISKIRPREMSRTRFVWQKMHHFLIGFIDPNYDHRYNYIRNYIDHKFWIIFISLSVSRG